MDEFKSVKNSLLVNRLLLVVLITVTAFLAYSIFMAWRSIQTVEKEIAPVVERVQQIDFEGLNELANSLDSEKVNTFFDSLNSVSKMAEDVDAAKINEALDKLMEASDDLEALSEALTPILNIFGR